MIFGTQQMEAERLDSSGGVSLEPRRVLWFVYAGRLIVSVAVFGSALLVGGPWLADFAATDVPGRVQMLAATGLAAAAVLTPLAYWHSHRRAAPIDRPFLLSQAALDILIVTLIVHLTGGSESVFPPLLYVALVTAYALMLPIRPALLVVAAAGAAYVLDLALAYPQLAGLPALFQIVIFAGVATASSYIGARLRETRRELEAMEAALRKLRLNTIDVLHSLRSAVLTVDAEGTLAYVNPLAEDLLGLPSAHWVGRNVLPELQRRSPGLATAFRDTVRAEASIQERELEIESASESGEVVPVTVRTAYLARSGGTPTVTLLLHDLRPTQRLQQLRHRTNRLQAVTELSASLAHEIRNPLSAIQSAAEQLSDRTPDDRTEQKLTDLVVRESRRLDRLLGEFGDFAGMRVSDREPVEIEAVAGNVVEVARQRPETPEDARFDVRVEGFERDEVGGLWGDPDLLHRALLNLVINAVQAWEEDGGGDDERLRVEVVVDPARPDVVPAEIAAGRPVRVRVVDNGPGISEEERDRLFDPFYSGREEGSGLGLSVAYRVARAHGGTINVDSRPGEGATFSLFLPRREPEARELLADDEYERPELRSPREAP